MALDPQLVFIGWFLFAIALVAIVMIYLFIIGSREDRTRALEQRMTTAERVKTAVIGGFLILIPLAFVLVTLFISTLPLP
ncbi:MAG: hypothetical protein ACFFC7_13790 [Candidatus Hermodarchaeota archaeon]